VRVVLPAAVPGVFSASMIGLGRAIGETMIVVMATGGTAVMDFSPFSGFRTLSNNIATEMPEATAGGTLYRVLFLSGLLLFALTFAVNTIAEVVRIRFRARFKGL
jgi:phosphate transport system permease protein